MENVLLAGKKNRSVGATLMNQLNLVDLAGSERQSKTGATGQRARKLNMFFVAPSPSPPFLSSFAPLLYLPSL
eukprot:758178-Hanusia_phi.AAC.3